MGVQLFHHHLLKRLFFLPWTVFTHFVKNQSDGFVWVYFCNCYGHSSVCLSHDEYYIVLINVILWYILKLGSMIFLTLLFFKIILVVLVLLSFQINFTIYIFYIYKNIYFFKIHTFIYKYILLYIYKTVYTHILFSPYKNIYKYIPFYTYKYFAGIFIGIISTAQFRENWHFYYVEFSSSWTHVPPFT